MIEYWELEIEVDGKWDSLGRYDTEPEADDLLAFLKGCPTNDGKPRKYRKQRFAVTNMAEGAF
jgi:hypothetical protein